MKTLIEKAKEGIITPIMEEVAVNEGVSPEFIRDGLAAGTIVIPANPNHKSLKAVAIGEGLSVKINANIGTSEEYSDIDVELKKLETCIKNGADAVMDLSTGNKINETRKEIIKNSTIPVGTVPIYQAGVETLAADRSMIDMTADDIFNAIIAQAEDGVDFITVHCGLTRQGIDHLMNEGRVTDVVSRGGSFLTGWMLHNDKENPLYEQYDRLLEISRKYELTLSLGDGLRPGCLADATDRGQIHELLVLGELVDRAREAGVQSMVEGPGHVPYNQIETNIRIEKELCKGAPFYVLGPLVTDIAPGYDHIVSAIGGTLAASAGADFLCYVTPAEHLGLPTIDDVKEGVIASKIAAHAADIARGNKKALQRNLEMAKARKALDWDKQIELAIDPEKARNFRKDHNTEERDVCAMCGQFCAMKICDEAMNKK
ncbi:phosphomethylpyrimidine synthase ThiC [Natronospora cellulosivora (SeqCode)]